VACGLVTAVLTGWVVGGLLAGLAVWWLPLVLGAGGAAERSARIEGVAGWTEMLRDTLAAAAGLEQTVLATAPHAPEAVRQQILDLAARVERGDRLPAALRQLAQDLADPTADLVVAALVLASGHEGRMVSPLLGELAATARAQVEMHQRVDANRARTRTTTRVVVGTTLFFAGGLIVLNPAFLSPYDSATGQLVLLLIGALFTAGFAWLHRMSHFEEPERFFTALDTVSTAGQELD
jgi:Flp pilus assembly protein TadB